MATAAGFLLAVDALLYLVAFLAVVALSRTELRRGFEVEAEVKPLSLGLRFHVRPQRPSGGETPAGREA